MKRLLALFVLLTFPQVTHAQQAEIVEYYAQDVIGSIRVVFDVNGTARARQDYAPFGRQLFPVPAMPKEGFGAQENDAETEQGYFHARMLQARTGRFTAVDRIFNAMFEPQAWNRYAYALNRPLVFTDPTGTNADPCAGTDYNTGTCVTGHSPTNPDWSGDGPSCWWPCSWNGGGGGGGSFSGGGGGRGTPSNPVPTQPPTTTTPTDDAPKTPPNGPPQPPPAPPQPGPPGKPACKPYWGRVKDDFLLTNQLPGTLAPSGLTYGLRAAETVGQALVPRLPTYGQVFSTPIELFGNPGTLIIDGVSYSTLEGGILATLNAGVSTLVVGVAFEGGVAAGSMMRAAFECR